MTPPPSLVVSALAATVSAVMLLVARLVGPDALATSSPEAMLPTLMAGAALCIVGLTVRQSPSAVWLATIAALSITTIDLAAFARATQAAFDPVAWRWLSIALCVSAGFATGAAVAYATDRRRRLGDWVFIVGWLTLVLVLIVCLAALGAPAGPAFVEPDAVDAVSLGTLNLVTRTFLVAVLGFTLVGIAGDARPAAQRARRRVASDGPGPSTARDRVRHALAVANALVDEIGPGRTRARQAALAERSRIARELHAEVVPAIRQALAEAERDGSPERLAATLRAVLREVDALVASRHSVVLEVGGLIPAIEWLAERTEDRSDVRVTIDVADPASDGAARPPTSVTAAAYRIAELALENVVRHAPRAFVRIDVTAEPELVSLTIADDGPGLVDGRERTAAAAGRRGLVDMRAEASNVDASLQIAARDDGRGTAVRFRWPADRGRLREDP